MSLPRNTFDVFNLSDEERDGVEIPRRITNHHDYDLSRSKKYMSMSPSRYSPQFGLDLVDEKSVPRRLRHSKTVDINSKVSLDITNESKVLVLYTGGTIGMVRNRDGVLIPKPHAMERKIRSMCTMHDEEYTKVRFGHMQTIDEVEEDDETEDTLLPLVLPHIPDHRRVIYTIREYDPLLDSCNMTMDDWIQIACDIKKHYKAYDGFVVLHGTDTLAYTASALSFMLENLGKPVIVTGSQIPTFETRSDGRDNFVGALILAGNYNIPEVTVFFRHQLMRGNRTVKVDAGSLDAFHSPNLPPLVTAGIDIDVNYKAIHRPTTIEKFRVHTTLNRNVVLLRLFPSIRSDTVAHFLNPPIEGLVLQCYGSGNIPSNRTDILKHFKDATDRGVIIISVTQCTQGSVGGMYETGKALLDCGVIPGADMTPEAALTKLSYVLSKSELDSETKRRMMQTNVAGEMTVLNLKEKARRALLNAGTRGSSSTGIDDMDLIHAVSSALRLQTAEERQGIEEALFPPMLCAAVAQGNLERIKSLQSSGADVTVEDYDHRTPLHIAASEGYLEVVKFLMENGAGIHVKDRNNQTPLMCAIENGHEEVIKALVMCGAHLQLSNVDLGENLVSCARRGKLQKLMCFHLAGANLNSSNLSKQTALHAAIETGQKEVVTFLLKNGVDVNLKDCYDRTPLDIAQILKKSEMMRLIL